MNHSGQRICREFCGLDGRSRGGRPDRGRKTARSGLSLRRGLGLRRGFVEGLESRELLAADLIGHWAAEDLTALYSAGDSVATWADATQSIAATASGTPTLIQDARSGRAMVRFDPADGPDSLTISRDDSPMSYRDDFSLVAVFSSEGVPTTGDGGEWYQHAGIVDSNSLGLATDWGLSLNASGQVAVGMGDGFGKPSKTLYSAAEGLSDGELHFVTFTRQGDRMSIYVDDQPVDTVTGASSAMRGKFEMVIGRLRSGDGPFAGDLAEVRVYDGALSDSEVAQLYSELDAFYRNSPPQPLDDTFVTDEDFTFFVVPAPGVLANDFDADGDPLTAELVDLPAHGSLALQANGSFFYSPQRNYFGTDTFTYRVRDYRDSEVLGTVTIEIRPKYDPPSAIADTYKAVPSELLSVSSTDGLLKNDTNIDQVELTVELEQDVASGHLILNPDGSFEYDAQGFAGTTTFTYRVNDQTTLTAPATVTLVVNTPPIPAADEFRATEDVPLVKSALNGVLANDLDADGDSLTATLDVPPLHGQLTFSDDGSFSYLPDEDYAGDDLFSYRISDGVDTSTVAFVQIVVEAVNDVPIAAEDFYFALPAETLTVTPDIGLLVNDRDVESPTLSAELVRGASNGVVNLARDGSFTYRPAVGFIGTDSFTYRATDGEDLSLPTTVTFTVTDRPVSISEFMASNAETVSTRVRASAAVEFVGPVLSPDWIELHNLISAPVDLGGLYLTDDSGNLAKWQFPQGTVIEPNGFLVVFASGLDVTETALDEHGWLHTNFQLGQSGDYLALVGAEGKLLDGFEGGYPPQQTHVSYGRVDDGAGQYFVTPTPGAANANARTGLAASTQFSVERGLYSAPFQLAITTATPSAEIRYTTDGSLPTETNGIPYELPLTIDRTSTIRARAFGDGLVPSETTTHSYFFLTDVVEQDTQAALAAGFPARWGSNAADYGLDAESQFPLIAGDRNLSVDQAKQIIQQSLTAIPTLSLVMNIDDMFGTRGIYANPTSSGSNWERPTSVELIRPDETEGFHIDAGIRIQGGAFRGFGLTPKKSFRLLFKSTYGEGKLNYPLFGDDAVQQFDTLTLRMESNDGWQWGDAGGQPQYARRVFAADAIGDGPTGAARNACASLYQRLLLGTLQRRRTPR